MLEALTLVLAMLPVLHVLFTVNGWENRSKKEISVGFLNIRPLVFNQGSHLLTTVKKRKLKWYSYVSRSSGLSKTILQGKRGETKR